MAGQPGLGWSSGGWNWCFCKVLALLIVNSSSGFNAIVRSCKIMFLGKSYVESSLDVGHFVLLASIYQCDD